METRGTSENHNEIASKLSFVLELATYPICSDQEAYSQLDRSRKRVVCVIVYAFFREWAERLMDWLYPVDDQATTEIPAQVAMTSAIMIANVWAALGEDTIDDLLDDVDDLRRILLKHPTLYLAAKQKANALFRDKSENFFDTDEDMVGVGFVPDNLPNLLRDEEIWAHFDDRTIAEANTIGGDRKTAAEASGSGTTGNLRPEQPQAGNSLSVAEKPEPSYPKAQLIIEYNPAAGAAWERVKELPEKFHLRFLEGIENNPSQNAEELAASLQDEYQKELAPYESKEANEALAQARTIGPEAEAEFKEAWELVRDVVKPDQVLAKLEKKYGLSERTKERQAEARRFAEQREQKRLEQEQERKREEERQRKLKEERERKREEERQRKLKEEQERKREEERQRKLEKERLAKGGDNVLLLISALLVFIFVSLYLFS